MFARHSVWPPTERRGARLRKRYAPAEPLEPRYLAAADWHNAALPCDVNGDGIVTSLDAQLVITEIRKGTPTQLPPLATNVAPPAWFDVSGEGKLTNLDVLLIVTELRAESYRTATLEGNVTQLALSAPTSDRIVARWTTDGPLAPSYLVSLAQGGPGAATTSSWVVDSLSAFTVSQLRPNTTYTVHVSARDAQGLVAPGYAQTITTPPLEATNTYRLDRALEAGRAQLAGVFDADNGNVPFFYGYSISRAAAMALGDYSSRRSNPGFAFERHLTSNTSGRALYALLLAQDVLGTPSNTQAITQYSQLVARMLHKPANGNYADTSPQNQLVVGLAADPRAYGTQTFDFYHLYNVGAGMRGALALATLSANPAAILPGYNESGAQLFEMAVDNLRRWYVYGGNLNGPRVYNWESFRAHFQLTGGSSFNSTVAADTSSNWSTLSQGWADPFLVYALVKHYEATGYGPALALAQELRDVSFYTTFPRNPAQVPANTWQHMFEPVAEMNAYARLALVLGDADMMDRVRVRYEYIKQNIASDTGWVPETRGAGSDVGEINNTGELIETALTLAQWGWTQYYEDAERFTRGQLLPAQLLDTSFIPNNLTATADADRNVAARLLGAFGFPAPYGHLPTLKPYFTGGYFSDVTAGAVTSLAEVLEAAYTFTGGAHRVNLLFDVNNAQITVVSPYPAGDQLQITTHAPGDVYVRLPSWADTAALAASLTAQQRAFEFTANGYVRVIQPPVNVAFALALPLAGRRTTEVVNGRQLTVDWRGDSVVAMSQMGSPQPFFPQPK